jgi:hypothetical protein
LPSPVAIVHSLAFAFDETRPLAVFVGIRLPQSTSVRKVKKGETTNDLYGFLTTEARAGAFQLKGQAPYFPVPPRG